jgi:septal ring factor EnvC (AmiA/AmiB activator)
MKKPKNTSISDLWESFKLLSWWEKALLLIPFLIVILIFAGLHLLPNKEDVSSKIVIQHSKKKTDKEVKRFSKAMKELEKENKEIDKEVEKIRKETENATTRHIAIMERIDSSPADDLDAIAAELRTGSATSKPTTRS